MRDRSAAGAPDEREDDEDIALRVRYRDHWDTGERLTLDELCEEVGLGISQDFDGCPDEDWGDA